MLGKAYDMRLKNGSFPEAVNYYLTKNKKDMKIKVKESVIMKYYDKACEDVKEDLRKDFPELFKNELAKTFEEYLKIKGYGTPDRIYNYLNISGEKHEKDYKKFWGGNYLLDKYEALRKLELLRDHYNDGWKPDINNDKMYSIAKSNELNSTIWNQGSCHLFLTLKTEQLRNEFFNNFKDLIEQAGDLI